MMATNMISSRHHNQMMKHPKSSCHNVARLQHPSTFLSSDQKGTVDNSIRKLPSSSFVPFPENPSLNKKKRGPPSPHPPLSSDQNNAKKSKTVLQEEESSPSLSPMQLRAAFLRTRFAETIMKAQKKTLESFITDPVRVQKKMEELNKKMQQENEMAKAQIEEEEKKRLQEKEEAQRKADLALKKKRDAEEKEKKRRLEVQRRRQRVALEKMEKAALRSQKAYCLTLKDLGLVGRCQYAWSWGCRGQHRRSPLEQMGLYLKEEEDPDEFLRKYDEMEEGEIVED